MNIKRFLLLGIMALYAIIPAWGQAQKVEIRGSVIDDEGEPAISIVIRDQNEKGDSPFPSRSFSSFPTPTVFYIILFSAPTQLIKGTSKRTLTVRSLA